MRDVRMRADYANAVGEEEQSIAARMWCAAPAPARATSAPSRGKRAAGHGHAAGGSHWVLAIKEVAIGRSAPGRRMSPVPEWV